MVLSSLQLQTFNERLKETEDNWKSVVNELNESKLSWEEQKNIKEEEMKQLVSRCDELVNQNTLLHEQGEKVTTVERLRRKFQAMLQCIRNSTVFLSIHFYYFER